MKHYSKLGSWILLLLFLSLSYSQLVVHHLVKSKLELKNMNKNISFLSSLQRLFCSINYHALKSIMVIKIDIDEPIKNSALHNVFTGKLSVELESGYYRNFVFLVYIIEPHLIQLRLGNHYSTFGYFCGVT